MTSTVAIAAFVLCIAPYTGVGIEDKEFWLNQGQQALRDALNLRDNQARAKNVVLFVGDGMGTTTVTTSRIFNGQQNGQSGEETKLNFERFPNVAFSKTYSVDRQTTDSSASGTAIVSGVKNNLGTLGFDARVKRGDCSLISDPSVRLDTVLDWSLAEGKSVGIVSTARVTHASPAALFSHSADRYWETDSKVPEDCDQLDIAAQLIYENPNISVVLGGGLRSFRNRKDNKDLTDEWLALKKEQGTSAKFVENQAQFEKVDPSTTDFLLGLFTESHMTWEQSRDPTKEPSLTEMTTKAIEILRKNENGFFLFVEGLVDPVDPGQEATDGRPYTTLTYADGSGPDRTFDLSKADTLADDFQFPRIVPLLAGKETHGGEDVGIFAKGPWSHLFHGVQEQSYIAHVMAYASCVGPNIGYHCRRYYPYYHRRPYPYSRRRQFYRHRGHRHGK